MIDEAREEQLETRTMPVDGFLGSLNHDPDCNCEWCEETEGPADES